jgi:5-formyltetrahydrofolate cyclo-ligase
MLKTEARKIYKEKRQALSVAEQSKLDDLILIQFQKLQIPFLHFLMAYWPIENNKEVNIHPMVDYLAFINPELRIAYPKTDFATNEMITLEVNDETDFVQNEFSIHEPVAGDFMAPIDFDLVLVPMLACDSEGCRVGYGKGFYDKYLSHCRDNCIKVGFSYFEPVNKIDDRNDFDVSLNYCITPQKVYVF